MIVETWYRCICTKCEAVNWVCDGDTQDMTVSDVEGVRCWKCKHAEPFDENGFDDDDFADEEEGHKNYEEGLKKPR